MKQSEETMAYEISRTYPVPRKVLFDALTDADTLKRIWGVQELTVDARAGGSAHAVYVVGDQDWSFSLTYTEVRPDESLRWTTSFKSFPTKHTRVTVTFVDADPGAEVIVRMENFETAEERDANRQAWDQGLAVLADILR